MNAPQLYQKLKNYLKVCDFGGNERWYLLKNKIMYMIPGRGYASNKKYRCAIIGDSAKVIMWEPNKNIGHIPTFSEFLALYPEARP